MSEIIDIIEPAIPGGKGDTGDTGPAGTITSATAQQLPPGSNPTVTLGGTPAVRTIEFGIPQGAKGDPGSGSVNSVNGDFGPDITLGAGDVGAVATVNGKSGPAVTLGAADVGGSTAATSGTMPLRTTGGRLPGIGDPSLVADAANKRYVDTSLQTALETVASVDDLIFTTRHDCGYSASSAIVEFTATSVHTVMVAPFALEITSVVLSFERFSIARHASNYVRAWPQRVVNGEGVPMATQKNTSTGSGGEAITARKAWSLTDGGMFDNIAAAGDLVAVVLGVTGSPGPIQYPFTVTMTYRPV